MNEVDQEIDESEGYASFKDPGEASVEYPEDPNLPAMTRAFLGREGQKLMSFDAETDYVRKMGIAAGNKREFGTYIIDDVIIEPVKGKSNSCSPSLETERILLKAKENSAKMVHYHPSGYSFGPEDLLSFSNVPAFSEMRITTADGNIFIMRTLPKSIHPDSNTITRDYTMYQSFFNGVHMPKTRKGMTWDEARRNVSRDICKKLGVLYNWDYVEVISHGRK